MINIHYTVEICTSTGVMDTHHMGTVPGNPLVAYFGTKKQYLKCGKPWSPWWQHCGPLVAYLRYFVTYRGRQKLKHTGTSLFEKDCGEFMVHHYWLSVKCHDALIETYCSLFEKDCGQFKVHHYYSLSVKCHDALLRPAPTHIFLSCYSI